MVDKKKLKGVGNSQDKSSPQTALLRAQKVASSVKAVICRGERKCHTVFKILGPLPGIKPEPLVMKTLSPNRWPTREFPVKAMT